MTTIRTNAIGIYVIEEQEIYHQIFRNILKSRSNLNLLGASSNYSSDNLIKAVSLANVDMLLVGVRHVTPDLLSELESFYAEYPRVGLILLVACVSSEDICLLRRLLQIHMVGIAIYLKQALDNPEQLINTIHSVALGQVNLDPEIANLIKGPTADSLLGKQLTETEMEILDLLRQGFTNRKIAVLLSMDIRMVNNHVSDIYGKLKENKAFDQKYSAVNSTGMFFEITGDLSSFSSINRQSMFPLF